MEGQKDTMTVNAELAMTVGREGGTGQTQDRSSELQVLCKGLQD